MDALPHRLAVYLRDIRKCCCRTGGEAFHTVQIAFAQRALLHRNLRSDAAFFQPVEKFAVAVRGIGGQGLRRAASSIQFG